MEVEIARRGHQAPCTYNEDETLVSADMEDEDPELHEALVAFQNAKSKYNSMAKQRGYSGGGALGRDEKLKAVKAKTFCSVCGKRAHWHKDPGCPANKNKSGGAPHSAHVVYFTSKYEKKEQGYYGITDCACARTLAGLPWCKAFMHYLREKNIPYIILTQNENFKFGGAKLYPSTQALVTWLCICGGWFLLKVSVVNTDVPLLLSRAVLAKLGMNYNLANNTATFGALGGQEIQLNMTQAGHPEVCITYSESGWPTWPDCVDWSLTEIFIPQAAGAYMVRADAADSLERGQKLFFPKKIDPVIRDIITKDMFSAEVFLNWWRNKDHLRDFWVETD